VHQTSRYARSNRYSSTSPFNDAFIPGSSSSGSAAAVAAGLCYATLDTDAIGSCRLPAACCGVVALEADLSMPSNERVRLDDGEDSTPVDQPRQRDECNAGRIIGPPRLGLPLEVQRQLLAQKQILGGELDGRPQLRRHESQDVASDARNRAASSPERD
jgi:hypothetical protein